MPENSYHCYILYGPTASGKSALAERIAGRLPVRIINADSKQVIREIPVLTAQPCAATQGTLPHALYGHVPLLEPYAIREWLDDVNHVLEQCRDYHEIPLFVGGSGMLMLALTDGMSPIPPIPTDIELAERARVAEEGAPAAHSRLATIDPGSAARLAPNDAPRITKALCVYEATGETLTVWHGRSNIPAIPQQWQVKPFTLQRPRETLYRNAEIRFNAMLTQGALDEANVCASLLAEQPYPSPAAAKAHGLPELLAYLRGELPLDEAKQLAVRNTRHYIKRQHTWMRHRMASAIALDSHDDAVDAVAMTAVISSKKRSVI